MNRFTCFTQRFLRDESGGVMILFGLFLTVFLGFIALAVVMGNSTILKARMQNASDAGALAGAYPDAATDAERTTLARRYFALNYPDNYLGKGMTAERARVEIVPATNAQPLGVRVRGTHQRDNEMMTVLDPNLNKAAVNSNALVRNGNASNVIDMVMVMDASGSMFRLDPDSGSSRIDAAASAANIVIDELLDTPVRTGSTIRWLDYTYYCHWDPFADPDGEGEPVVPGYPKGFPYMTKRYDCRYHDADELFSAGTYSAAGPARAKVEDYVKRVKAYDTDLVNWTPPNNQTWFITNGIDALKRVLPLPTPRVGAVRAVIYMTDGLNNIDNDHLYFVDPRLDNPTLHSDIVTSTAAACDDIKRQDNVVLYVVGFGPNACNTAGQQLLRSCATGPNQYFCANTDDELRGVFRSIITNVKTLRITE